MNLHCLNGNNSGAQWHINEACRNLVADESLKHYLVGVEFGIAYGGAIQQIGRILGSRGVVHGFDTFEGHPAEMSYSNDAFEATCMEQHYKFHGVESLSYEYQRGVLDEEGLHNVILHKGLINSHSLDEIGRIDYAMLDVDMIASMVLCWTLIKDKMGRGAILCLHDVVPRGHLVGLWGLYQEIMATGEYEVIEEQPLVQLAVLKKVRTCESR